MATTPKHGPAPTPSPWVGVGIVVLAGAAVALLLSVGDGPSGNPSLAIDRSLNEAGREDAELRVRGAPAGLASAGGVTWVALPDAGVVKAIPRSASRPDPSREIDLGPDAAPRSVAVGFGSVWIADEDRLVRSPLSGKNTTTIPLPGAPRDVAVGPDGVWVALESENSVARIDPETDAVASEVPVGASPRALAVASGRVWVVCAKAGEVQRLDGSEGRPDAVPLPAGVVPAGIAAGVSGIWVTDAAEGAVRRIDPKTLRLGRPIGVGARPRDIVSARGAVWTANFGDDTVTRVGEADRRRLGEPIRVGAGPVAITAGGDSIWTANSRAATVSRIAPGR